MATPGTLVWRIPTIGVLARLSRSKSLMGNGGGLISWILVCVWRGLFLRIPWNPSKVAVRRARNEKFLEILIYILYIFIYLYIFFMYKYIFIYILFLKYSWNIVKFLVSCSPNGHYWKISRNPQKTAFPNAAKIQEIRRPRFGGKWNS